MGLFSNNKKLCPICGSPTPRLLATVVDDQPLCKACAAKIDLPDGSLANMSIEAFRNYLDFLRKTGPCASSSRRLSSSASAFSAAAFCSTRSTDCSG